MSDLLITYAGIDYLDRTRPLLDGGVKPEGISLKIVPFQWPFELFRRVVQSAEFDAAEMSFSTYVNLISRGNDRYIAIPFFPSRHFRHGDIYVHRDSGITQPGSLRGRKVGIPQYQMTAAVWQRAFLQYDYGVLPSEIHWYTPACWNRTLRLIYRVSPST
jgi:4,5-dihydroxyphthalate decarboxylase